MDGEAWRKFAFEFRWRCKTCAKRTLSDWTLNILHKKKLQCCCFFRKFLCVTETHLSVVNSSSLFFACYILKPFKKDKEYVVWCCGFLHLFLFASKGSAPTTKLCVFSSVLYVTRSTGSIICCCYQVDCNFFFHPTDSFFWGGSICRKEETSILFKFFVKGAGNLSIGNVWDFFLHWCYLCL